MDKMQKQFLCGAALLGALLGEAAPAVNALLGAPLSLRVLPVCAALLLCPLAGALAGFAAGRCLLRRDPGFVRLWPACAADLLFGAAAGWGIGGLTVLFFASLEPSRFVRIAGVANEAGIGRFAWNSGSLAGTAVGMFIVTGVLLALHRRSSARSSVGRMFPRSTLGCDLGIALLAVSWGAFLLSAPKRFCWFWIPVWSHWAASPSLWLLLALAGWTGALLLAVAGRVFNREPKKTCIRLGFAAVALPLLLFLGWTLAELLL